MLRRIFGPKRNEVTGEWGKLTMRSLLIYILNQYFLGNRVEKNEMGGACSTYGGRGEAYTGIWWGNLLERVHLGDPGVDGRIILRWIFWKLDVGVWTDRAGSVYRQVAGTCECGNGPSGTIKCGEFLDSLRTGELHKKDSLFHGQVKFNLRFP
jgi:hypothetical protein